MKIRGRVIHSMVTLPLAATIALAACAPQVVKQAQGGAVDVPAAVEQVQQTKLLPVGTFTGMVATFDGHDFVPVAGAVVQPVGTNVMAITDQNGNYTINGMKPGSYKVAVTKDGFSRGEMEVLLNPASGTPRVHAVLNKAEGYGLKQAVPATPSPINATVSGVVKDPRGAALPNAKVHIAVSNGANQTIDTNANGMYSFAVNGIGVTPQAPGYVQVTAYGTTPGGVKVETSAPVTKTITGVSTVMDPSCDAFTRPKNLTFPGGTFKAMGATDAKVKAEWMSTRADEFYIELVSGGQKYAVIPDAIANTPAGTNNSPPQSAEMTFRVPFTLPGNTFSLEIMPFGKDLNITGPGNFVVQYDATAFENDVSYAAQTFTDAFEPGGAIPANINSGNFVAGEDAKYTITLINSSTDVSQDIKLEGKAPVGAKIASAKITRKVNGVNETAINLPTTDISDVNGTGDWSIGGGAGSQFTVPAKQGANNGECAVEIVFTAPVTAAKASNFQITNLAVKMPSASNIAKTTAPNTLAGLTVRNIVPNDIAITTGKAIADVGAAGDGVARVTFSITATNADALGAIKIQDITASDAVTPAANATIKGTKSLPPAGTAMSGTLLTTDKLAVKVDGGAEKVINVLANNWDLETLCGFVAATVNSGGVVVTCQRENTTSNAFLLQRTDQGASKTLEITSTSTNNLLTILGISTGVVAGANGLVAEFSGAGASVAQANGTAWTFTNTSSTHVAGGNITANFTIVPPAAYSGGDGPATRIDVSYRIVKQGGGALALGNGGAAAGPRLLAVNLIAPFTTSTKDQTLPQNANTDKDDASPQATNL